MSEENKNENAKAEPKPEGKPVVGHFVFVKGCDLADKRRFEIGQPLSSDAVSAAQLKLLLEQEVIEPKTLADEE